MAKFNPTEMRDLYQLLERHQKAKSDQVLITNWLNKEVREKLFIVPQGRPEAKLFIDNAQIDKWIARVDYETNDIEAQIDRIFEGARGRDENQRGR